MLLRFKFKIIEDKSTGTQIAAAKRLEMPEARLSKIIHQHVEPNASERARIVAAFGAGVLKSSPARKAQSVESEVGHGR